MKGKRKPSKPCPISGHEGEPRPRPKPIGKREAFGYLVVHDMVTIGDAIGKPHEEVATMSLALAVMHLRSKGLMLTVQPATIPPRLVERKPSKAIRDWVLAEDRGEGVPVEHRPMGVLQAENQAPTGGVAQEPGGDPGRLASADSGPPRRLAEPGRICVEHAKHPLVRSITLTRVVAGHYEGYINDMKTSKDYFTLYRHPTAGWLANVGHKELAAGELATLLGIVNDSPSEPIVEQGATPVEEAAAWTFQIQGPGLVHRSPVTAAATWGLLQTTFAKPKATYAELKQGRQINTPLGILTATPTDPEDREQANWPRDPNNPDDER